MQALPTVNHKSYLSISLTSPFWKPEDVIVLHRTYQPVTKQPSIRFLWHVDHLQLLAILQLRPCFPSPKKLCPIKHSYKVSETYKYLVRSRERIDDRLTAVTISVT